MTERRALLTDREREIVAGDADDVRDAYKYQTISRVRRRFARLADDLVALEAHGGLADELREVVCGESTETPSDPESELRRLSNELGEPITVGETVYESGDSYPLDASEPSESGVGPDPDVDERREPPGEPNLDAEDRIADPAADGTPTGEQDAETASESEPATESTPADVETALDELDLDDDRREAVRAMYEYLRDAGTARKSDFTGDVYPAHPAGFGSAGGWWNRLGKDALGELPNARKPPEGRPMWQWVGEDG